MILGPLDFFRIVLYPFHLRIFCDYFLAKDGVSRILLVGEDVVYGTDRPPPFSRGTEDAQGLQLLLDPHDAPTLRIPSEDPPHDIGFMFIDHEVLGTIMTMTEAQSGEEWRIGMRGASPDAPSDVGTLIFALRLGEGRMERHYQLSRLTGQQHILMLKVDIHSKLLQSPDHHQEIHAVATESTDRFGVDEINLAGLAICHEALEARTDLDFATCVTVKYTFLLL